MGGAEITGKKCPAPIGCVHADAMRLGRQTAVQAGSTWIATCFDPIIDDPPPISTAVTSIRSWNGDGLVEVHPSRAGA